LKRLALIQIQLLQVPELTKAIRERSKLFIVVAGRAIEHQPFQAEGEERNVGLEEEEF